MKKKVGPRHVLFHQPKELGTEGCSKRTCRKPHYLGLQSEETFVAECEHRHVTYTLKPETSVETLTKELADLLCDHDAGTCDDCAHEKAGACGSAMRIITLHGGVLAVLSDLFGPAEAEASRVVSPRA